MVSVIVPNYNHAPYLCQRIDSILSQTYQDFELILLDDCSTDNSREIFERYRENPHVTRIVCNETNGGTPFKQWDKGIELAQGEWIWIAESDDWAEPKFLETLMAAVSVHPECGLAYTWTNWVDSEGRLLWKSPSSDAVNVYDSERYIKEKLLVCNSIANVSECIFKKSLYKGSQTYRYEWMRLCGDWFFYVLLAEQAPVVESQLLLSNYRQHSSNVSSEAEHRGLTFLEGIHILDYIRSKHSLKTADYAKSWGRLWAKYQRLYDFTPDTNEAVARQIRTKFPSIYIYYRLYKLRWVL